MQLYEIIQAANFKITEGSEYLWKCYGANARILDFSDFKGEDAGVSCIFDFETKMVYEVSIYTKNHKYYRWIDSDYIEAYKNECQEKNVSFSFVVEDEEIKWINLDNTRDVFRKASQVIDTGDCDDEVTIVLDLDDDLLLSLCMMAHEKDITLNMLMKEILQDVISRAKNVLEDSQVK